MLAMARRSLVVIFGLVAFILMDDWARADTVCAEPVDGLPMIDLGIPLCDAEPQAAPRPDAAVPARFWRVAKAERRLENGPNVMGRRVLVADCEGVGRRIREEGVSYWRRFDCHLDHPGPFSTYAVLTTTGADSYVLLPYGGIG